MKKSGFKSLQILYFALLAGQLLFTGIAVFLVQSKQFDPALKSVDNILLPVSVLVALSGFMAGNKIFRSRLEKINDQQQAKLPRFSDYITASILRWALLEGPCLLAIIFFMLTSNYLFLIVVGALLFLFFTTMPSGEKVSAHLGVSPAELDTIT